MLLVPTHVDSDTALLELHFSLLDGPCNQTRMRLLFLHRSQCATTLGTVTGACFHSTACQCCSSLTRPLYSLDFRTRCDDLMLSRPCSTVSLLSVAMTMQCVVVYISLSQSFVGPHGFYLPMEPTMLCFRCNVCIRHT